MNNSTYVSLKTDIIKGAVLGALIGQRIGLNFYPDCLSGSPAENLFIIGAVSGMIITSIVCWSRICMTSRKFFWALIIMLVLAVPSWRPANQDGEFLHGVSSVLAIGFSLAFYFHSLFLRKEPGQPSRVKSVWHAEYLAMGVVLFLCELTGGSLTSFLVSHSDRINEPVLDGKFIQAAFLLVFVINAADVFASRVAGTPRRWPLQISCNTAVMVAILIDGCLHETFLFFPSIGLPAGIVTGLLLRKWLFWFQPKSKKKEKG